MYYFLIGFMGAGKTTYGKQLASQNDWQFIDLDAYIEEKTSKSISQLFEEKGEIPFRQIEADALRLLIHHVSFPPLGAVSPVVVACGGGTPLFHDNHDLMKAIGKTVYLKVKPEILFERLLKEKLKRPLIQNIPDEELLDFITYKLKEREIEYEKADYILT